MKQNNSCYLFGMYEPDTDSIVIYANDSDPFILNCQKCNSSVILDNPDDIVYLYRLAQDAPLLYAELALKADGLQGYVDAISYSAFIIVLFPVPFSPAKIIVSNAFPSFPQKSSSKFFKIGCS